MIKLLNGEQWNKSELLDKMLDDSFYYGHLGKHALSSSSCKMLLESPKTYRNITKYGSDNDSPSLRAGRLFHTLVLEPHKIDEMIFVECKTRATKVFKEALSQHPEREVYTVQEKKDAERLGDQCLRNNQVLQVLYGAEFEVPGVGVIEDIPFRAKADIVKDNVGYDLKTTTGISTFKYSADKYGYDLQAYLYKEIFGFDDFQFIVIDKKSGDLGHFYVSDEFLERGKKKLERAIYLYKYFFQDDSNDLDQYIIQDIL